MGILNKFFGAHAAVMQLPAGTVTVDRQGNVVTSTVSSGFPQNLLAGVGRDVVELLREARRMEMPLSEISLHFGSLRITAREVRGGAIIFFFPQSGLSATPHSHA